MALTKQPITESATRFGGCPSGYKRDPSGNCVYTGTFDPGSFAGDDWADLKKKFTPEEWGEYGEYFEQYDTFREDMLRDQAGVDIGQLEAGQEVEAGQLFSAWNLASTQLGEKKEALGDIWGIESAEIERKKLAAGDIWDLQAGEYKRQGTDAGTLWDLRKTDYEERSKEAGTLWGLKQTDFEKRSAGAGTLWDLQKAELTRGKTEATEMWDLREADITRQEKAAGTMWGLQKAGMEEEWGYRKEDLSLGAQSGLRQARRGQEQAQSRVGFATAGTREFERMQKDVREQYGRSRERGEAGLARNIGMGEEQLRQTLGGLGAQRGIGKLGLSQRLAELSGQIGIGAEQLSQTQAGFRRQIGIGAQELTQMQAGLGRQKGIGAEQYSQQLAELGYTIDASGNMVATGGGALGIGAAEAASAEAGFDYQQTIGKERLDLSQQGIQDLIDSGLMDYNQAIALSEFNLGQGTTDIQQGLGESLYGQYEKWKGEQRSMYETLMGMDIFDDVVGGLDAEGQKIMEDRGCTFIDDPEVIGSGRPYWDCS